MAWLNPLRKTTPYTHNAWGYRFEWSEDHLRPEVSEPLKFSCDTLADECLEILDKISPPARPGLPRNREREAEQDKKTESGDPAPARDLYILLRDNVDKDEKLQKLWKQVNTVPDWVDWEQIERGQDTFYRYSAAAITGLAFQSLLGGMGAARVTETLARTGGFSPKVARGRLFETTQHILQCTKSLQSLQPGGDGWASTIRVRFLHSAVRRRILKLAEARPEYYNVKEYGIPINDLDSIGTICVFSATLIWMSFPRQGIFLRKQETEDYVALWRYIAYVIGCPDEYFATAQKAKATMESVFESEVHPNEMGALLANNIIKSIENEPPTYESADMLSASARWLNGPSLSDALKLPNPGLYYWVLMAGQCLFIMGICYTYRAIPSWDKKKVANMKRILWTLVVESKWGLNKKHAKFDFQYVPEYSTLTELHEGKGAQTERSSLEMRNLKAFAAGIAILAAVTWVGVKITTTLVGLVWR